MFGHAVTGQLDLDSHPDVLLVRKHLVEHLGTPDEVFEISGSPIPNSPVQALNLAYFAPAGPNSPVVFSTCGACLYRMKDGRRVEAIVILRKEPQGKAFDAVHRMLASFALFAESNDEVVRYGDVVRAPDELADFCEMDALLFMPPIPFVETFHNFKVSEDKAVEVIWLLPVYESEAQYALEHGPQSLMMLFAAQGLDLTESDRDEANTMIDPADAQEMAKRTAEENQKKAADQPRPTPGSPVKPKSSRRNVGKGSFDVADSGGAVRITRRVKQPKPKTPEPPQAPEPEPEPVTSAPTRRPASKYAPQNKKPEVRFDLGAKKRPDPKVSAEPPKRKAPPPVLTPAQKAEAKKKRIEELKAQAKAAAKRAAKRATGDED